MKIVKKHIKKDNGFFTTVQSGSKCSTLNIQQIMGTVGQQTIWGSRVENGFTDRTLPFFPKNDIGVLHNKDGSLEAWALQGVLLLNSCLTVEVSKPGSHLEIGWDNFIKEIIFLLNKKNNLVFFLLGKNAQKYIKYIDSKSHLILTAAHPSPLSAYRGFFGCGHFSKCNDYLKVNGIEEISW